MAKLPLTLLIACAAGSSAWAQQAIQTSKERPDTARVTVSFDVDVDFVTRMVGLATALGDDDSVQDFEADAKVSFNVEFPDRWSLLFSVANQRLAGGPAAFLGLDGLSPRIWDLRIQVSQFMDEAVTIQVGTANDLMFDPRGRGSSLYAPSRSQSFGVHNAPDRTVGVASFITDSAGDQNTPAGLVFLYDRQMLHFGLALLPAVVEGGTSSDDEAAHFAWLYYDLGKGSRLAFLLANNSFTGKDTDVRTVGAGATVKDLVMTNLELFANVALNNGDAGRLGTSTLSAKGMAFELAAHYLLDAESLQWVELSLTQLSGDGDSAGDTDVDSFLGYVHRASGLLIVEDPWFGLNWNTNYRAIKVQGGMSFTSGSMKNNVNVTVALGLCSTVEDVGAAPDDTTKLGTEFDVRVVWWHSKAMACEINVGVLVGSDVLELATGGPGGDSESSTQVFTLGWRIQG